MSPAIDHAQSKVQQLMDLHKTLAGSHPSLLRGRVWCTKCPNTFPVDVAQCLRSGWPKCCGVTMTIDSPEERKGRRK